MFERHHGQRALQTYNQEHKPLKGCDRLFVYTDGVVEAPHGERLFCEERLLEALARSTGRDLPDVRNAVVQARRRHTGGSFGHDDVTLLIVEVN